MVVFVRGLPAPLSARAVITPPEYHTAIIGQTGSGKTFGAQQLARDMVSRGIKTVVLRKPSEAWPSSSASWQTDNPDTYLRMYWASKNVACFMELADAAVSKYDERFHKCFTEGRHDGRHNFYLTQRGAQVHPNIRENCRSLLIFSVAVKAANLWADEMNDLRLINAPIPEAIIPENMRASENRPCGAASLPPHWFFYKPNRFTPARLMKLAA